MLDIFLGTLTVLCLIALLPLPRILRGILAALTTGLLWGLGGWISLKAIGGNTFSTAVGILELDALGGFFLFVFCLVGGAVSLHVFGEPQPHDEKGEPAVRTGLFHGLTLAFLLIMALSLCTRNLGVTWVCIEGTTLVSALLIGLKKQRAAVEAAWKYIILCTVGLSFSLFGLTLLLHGLSQAGKPASLNPDVVCGFASGMPVPVLKLAFILMFIGYATKAGFAPLHFWLPDAHSQAPAPTSALLSAVLLNCSVFAILRIQQIMVAAGLGPYVQTFLTGFGMISILLASLFLLVQHDLKRMLAYSSIEHLGLILIGMGIGTRMALFAALLHFLGHSLSKSLAFLSAGEIVRGFHSHDMNRMVGVWKRLPFSGALFGLSMSSLSGLPPFPIFFSELLLVWAAIAAGKPFLALGIAGALAIAFAGLAFHGTRVVLGEDPFHHHHEDSGNMHHDSGNHDGKHGPDMLMDSQSGRIWRRTGMGALFVFLIFLPLVLTPDFSSFLHLVVSAIRGGPN